MKTYFTSESVTEGHPDKICDQIADAILDAILAKDPNARVACEVAVTTGLVHIFGEITTSCYVEIDKIARRVIAEIGYDNPSYGFDGNSCGLILSLGSQSKDIAAGVDPKENGELGAGDQGLIFGYACDETKEYMPLPISIAHKLAKRLAQVRKEGIIKYLRPDGKTQVTVEYEDGKPCCVSDVVLSAQHEPGISQDQIKKDLIEHVVDRIISNEFSVSPVVLINPSGRFVLGGPASDSGLTGRKIIVDTYGGFSRHGGGAFSGKDATKVDRSAAYMARYAAKNIVAAEIAKRCEIQVSYAIGISNPISLRVESFGTSEFSDEALAEAVLKVFDFRPASIIEILGLRRPIFARFASYGAMGREDLNAPWEALDKTFELKQALTEARLCAPK
ncbi:MAG: methionine adenosyltransferase [Oscillospiraceae bacterium]|jgi:S-adenosylmethionine synthetase|nr:methionine adenosyltransferase [Oscillospiraceae bacterium]